MKITIIFILGLFSCQLARAQINVALLHQLVAISKSEYSLQAKARDKQGISAVNEEMNRSAMNTLKMRYRQINSRFSSLGNAVNFLQLGLEATPLISEIYQKQALLLSLCADDPLLIPIALSAQIDLADRSGMLLRYLYGLMLSMGDLAQMRQSDRKILFSHAISELRSISGTLGGLFLVISSAKEKWQLKKNPFSGFIDRDQNLANSILQKIKTLKK